jgi:tetratricopeptide (TPR) repeat protein
MSQDENPNSLENARRIHDWLSSDEQGREVLRLLTLDDPSAVGHIRERLECGNSPVDVRTVITGGTVEKLTNIARIENLHIHPRQVQPQLSRPPGTRGRDRDLFYGYGVEFVGRSQELSELRTFVDSRQNSNEIDFAWWLWTAPGGQGKTRLGAQLCLELQREGWRCGFLPTTDDFDGWHDCVVDQPTLIVIDHVARRAERVRKAICALSRLQHSIRAPLRVLLLERPFNLGDSWVKEFVPEASPEDLADLFEYAYFPSGNVPYGDLAAMTRQLEPLDSVALWRIVTAIMEQRKAPLPDHESTLRLLEKIDPLLRPLFVIFAVDAIAAKGLEGVRKWNRNDLVTFIMRREFELWRRTLLGNRVDEGTRACFEQHINLVIFATIVSRERGDVCERLRSHGVEVPQRLLPDWLRVMTGYSVETNIDGASPVEPDLVGELFVLERLAGEFGIDSNIEVPRTQTQRLMDVAFALRPYQTIDFIKRSIDDFPDHPSIEYFPEIQIPEGEQAHYALYVDYSVHLSHVASILAREQKIDLAEECYTQLVKQSRRFASEEVLHHDYLNRLAIALYNRSLMRSRLEDVTGSMSDCNEVINIIDQSVLSQAIGREDYQFADLLFRALLVRAELSARSGDILKAQDDVAHVLGDTNASANMRAEALLLRAQLRPDSEDASKLADYETILALDGRFLEEVQKVATDRAVNLLVEMAYHRYRDRNDEAAIEYFNRLIQLTENRTDLNAMARVDRGLVLWRIGEERGARDDWTAVITDDNSPVEQKRKALVNRSQLLLSRSFLSEALKDVEAVLEDQTASTRDQALARFTRAQIHHFAGYSQGALADITALTSDSSVDHDVQDAVEALRQKWYS